MTTDLTALLGPRFWVEEREANLWSVGLNDTEGARATRETLQHTQERLFAAGYASFITGWGVWMELRVKKID